MEFRTGQGLIVFCQLDVSGRSEPEPAADALTVNLLRHVAGWKARPDRRAIYLGDAAGRAHLAAAGIAMAPDVGTAFSADDMLVLGPGAARSDPALQRRVSDFLRGNGRAVAIGLEQADLDALIPLPITVSRREHIATHFEPAPPDSAFAGIASADTMNRDPRQLSLVAAGADIAGNGVIATAGNGRIVLCQIVAWQFDPEKQSNLKRTFRRASVLVTRLLANQGIPMSAPILERFATPVTAVETKPRWSQGLYLDQPEEWDDPYRFFRW